MSAVTNAAGLSFMDSVKEFFGIAPTQTAAPVTQTAEPISAPELEPMSPTATTVSYTNMGSIVCPAAPVANISPSVSGLTFSQMSRGSGVTCASATTGINGAGFNGDLATNVAGSKWYTLSITSDASTTFTVDALSVVSQVSSAVAGNSVDIQYSIGAGAKTSVGSFTPTGSSATYPITPSSSISRFAGFSSTFFL